MEVGYTFRLIEGKQMISWLKNADATAATGGRRAQSVVPVTGGKLFCTVPPPSYAGQTAGQT